MKRIAILLIVCLMLSPAALAQTSSTDRFLSGLSQTWNAFLDMAGDAGRDASRWAEESGITGWVDGAASDISAWAKESGLTDWAETTLTNLTGWLDESGIAGWAEDTSRNLQAFIDENRPAIEAWLAGAGEEVRHAWDTLVNPNGHTAQDLEAAYDIVTESLEEMAIEEKAE